MNPELTKYTFAYPSDDIIEIFTNIRFMPIHVTQYKGDLIIIDYWHSDEYPCEINVNDNIIMLESMQQRAGWLSLIRSTLSGVDWSKYPVEIKIPTQYGGMLNLTTDAASISVTDIELWDRLHLNATNGGISVENTLAAALDFRATNGAIKARNTAATGFRSEDGAHPEFNRIRTTNGRIDLDGFSSLGAVDCATTNSPIKLNSVAIQGDLTCTSANGAIKLNDISVQDFTRASTQNASISLVRLLSRDIELQTTNSSIKGSVIGSPADFCIDTHTTNGRCMPASGNMRAHRRLSAYTTNSSINIDFI